MVALPESDRLEGLEAEVRRLRRTVRTMVVLLDAMREAWMIPPVPVLLADRRALRAAAGTTAPPAPVGAFTESARRVAPRALLRADPDDEHRAERAAESKAAPHQAALERIREMGRKAAMRGRGVDDCPYARSSGGYRQAWIDGHAVTAAGLAAQAQRGST